MEPPPRQEGYSFMDKLSTADAGGRGVGVKFWVSKGPISKDRRGLLNSEQTSGQVAPFPLAAGSPEESPTFHFFPTIALGPSTRTLHPKVSTIQEKVEVLPKDMTGPTPEGIPREDSHWKAVSMDDDFSLQGPLVSQASALSWLPSMTTDHEHQPPSNSPLSPGPGGQLVIQTDSVALGTVNSYVPFPINHALTPTVGAGEGKTVKIQSWSGKATTKERKQSSPKPGGGRSWSEAQVPQAITEKSSVSSILRHETLLKPELTSSVPETSFQGSRSLPIWISANRLPSVQAEEPDLRTGRWSTHFAHQISTQKAPLSPQNEDSDKGNGSSATLLPSSRSPSPSPVSNTTAPLSPGHQPGPGRCQGEVLGTSPSK